MREKKVVKRKILKGLQEIMERRVAYHMSEWPPACVGLMHQPKRPNNDVLNHE